MWEVDPETRSKLSQIAKKEGSGNDRCCDCGAPSPQWASPKFSTFICLSCAGVHRGLGVHISFVRSVSMDAFKQNEILRMRHGGNKAWQDFYNANVGSENGGKSFEDSTIKERYESDVGDEWKERLSAKVEDRDFDRESWKKEREAYKARAAANASNRSQTSNGGGAGPRKGGSSTRSDSPAAGQTTQKEKSEAYFSTLGAANASRPADLPPSQGGRYAGFGSSPSPPPPSTNSNLPTTSDLQSDPLTSITKSFGWFTTSLSRTAKTVNESYIQPTARNIASSDLAAQARLAAVQAGTGIQNSAKSASESFNRFVEGPEHGTRSAGGGGGSRIEPERKDFWDSFGEAETAGKAKAKPSSIGTAAMKTGAGSTSNVGNGPLSGGGTAAPSLAGTGVKDKGDDGWDNW